MLRALNEYYECLCRQENSPLTPTGFSKVGVSYNIVLSKDGELKEILPYTQTTMRAKKEIQVPREEIFPFRNSTSGIAAETIEHREKYIFGFVWDKDKNILCANDNSLLAFQKNKERNLDFLKELKSPIIDAYKNFLEHWEPKEQLENHLLLAMGKQYASAKFVVSIANSGELLNRDSLILEKWKSFIANKTIPKDAIVGQCSITGKAAPIARIHNNLKGIQGSLGTGANIVCYKTTAFESYGKSESYNSSISQDAMEHYTEAFNYLASDSQHKQVLDGTTLLFWAMTDGNEKPLLEQFNSIMGFGFSNEGSVKMKIDTVESGIENILKQLSDGAVANFQEIESFSNVQFYILGVRPNSSRLAVKLFEHNSFSLVMQNAIEHQLDMQFSKNDKQISLWALQKELKSPISNNELPPDLGMKLVQSILHGTPYPRYMLDTAVYRIKTDQDTKQFKSINGKRVRIIKACLTRLKKIEREDFSMLNQENKDSAYNCGRLFAVLESIQKAALPGINATIKDKYFSSACSTPYLAFPKLLKLTQNHLSKIGGGLACYFDKHLMEIIANLESSFPKILSIEKQGMFILGYYQQKESLKKKKENEHE